MYTDLNDPMKDLLILSLPNWFCNVALDRQTIIILFVLHLHLVNLVYSVSNYIYIYAVRRVYNYGSYYESCKDQTVCVHFKMWNSWVLHSFESSKITNNGPTIAGFVFFFREGVNIITKLLVNKLVEQSNFRKKSI